MPAGERFLSSNWYRVAGLRPRLPEHVAVRMQRYRGERWYAISDGLRNRVHRVSPAGYVLIAALDGVRTLDQVWSDVAISLGDQAPTQDQVIQLLGQLHSNDLLMGDLPADITELFQRQRQQSRSKVMQWILNPLSIRLPLLDLDGFLNRTMPGVRWLLGPVGTVLWLGITLPAVLLTAVHWPELTENLGDRVLATGNLLLIAAIYPLIKLLHELGHGYATKARGGSVHELGVMFLVLIPMPYVDVSSAAGFRGKWSRCLVGGAGMLVELFIAALALYAWLLLEPGFARSIAFNVMLTASVSSLLFNGNPLLRYDGYYVLADAIEIPNLGQRGTRYWKHLVDRYAFGMRGISDFPAMFGERLWFLLYTPAATFYRLSVTVAIGLFLAQEYMAVGIALALWGLASGVALPLMRGLWQVSTSPHYGRRRGRALFVTIGVSAAATALLLWFPAPMHSNADGVVWLPDDAHVRAGTDGFAEQLQTMPGAKVNAGAILLRSTNPELTAELRRLQAREDELMSKLDSVRFTDRVEAILTTAELDVVRMERMHAEQRTALLDLRAGSDGIFVMPRAEDVPGRYLHRGDLVGYTLPVDGARTVRVTVSQDNIDLVRHHLRATEAKTMDGPGSSLLVTRLRELPSGSDRLPSAALGTGGGGDIATDPHDQSGVVTLNRTFQFDLDLAEPLRNGTFGARIAVRFEHDWEPLGLQCWRRVQQLLLSRLSV